MHSAVGHCVTILVQLIVPLRILSVHCAVIKSFGQRIGADNKQVQGLVRLAKKNGEKLGFLA